MFIQIPSIDPLCGIAEPYVYTFLCSALGVRPVHREQVGRHHKPAAQPSTVSIPGLTLRWQHPGHQGASDRMPRAQPGVKLSLPLSL